MPWGNPRGSTEPNAEARQTLRTAWFGRHVCVKPYKSLYILTSSQYAKTGPEKESATRYAQCGFVDIGGFERFKSQQVRCMFCNVAKTTSSDDNIKSIKIIGNMRRN